METRKKITHLAEKAARRARYQASRKNFIKTANPFISIMLGRMMIKLWVKYNKEHQDRVNEHAAKGIYNYKSDDEYEDEYDHKGSDRSFLNEHNANGKNGKAHHKSPSDTKTTLKSGNSKNTQIKNETKAVPLNH